MPVKVKKKIALVGNGPLSQSDRAIISKFDKIVRFNDAKNYIKGDKTFGLAVRISSGGLHGFKKNGSNISINVFNSDIVRKNLKELYIIGHKNKFVTNFISKHFPTGCGIKIFFINNFEAKKGYSLSTGSRMIYHLINSTKSDFEIHVFGMNWNGHSKWHDFAFEKAFIHRLALTNNIKIYKTILDSYFPISKC